MTRRIKRTADFQLTLEISKDEFIRPPREAQRNWLLNRSVGELAADLAALDGVARRFVPGIDHAGITDKSRADLSAQEIMEDWQVPIMKAMAEAVTGSGGDILEIGFGRGVSADFIQEHGARSHTIVECNDAIVQDFHAWRQRWPDRDVRLIHGRWQDVTDKLSSYDGIFFHTYAMNEDEYIEYALTGSTFAEHFFATAAAHLRNGGVFVYLSNEIDSLSRAHQRALLGHFRRFSVELIDLKLPADVRDTWWADSMALVSARK